MKTADPATEASKALFQLFSGERPPRFLRVAHEFELSPPQLNVIRMLEPGVALPMSALAEALYCDPSNITGIVDRLEVRELIERQSDPGDRRVKRIVITRKGARLRERVLGRLYEPPAALQRLSTSEQRQLADLLHKALGDTT
jgi:MarR family transcriptional regulator, organic hydroperoxide resistance regulator